MRGPGHFVRPALFICRDLLALPVSSGETASTAEIGDASVA